MRPLCKCGCMANTGRENMNEIFNNTWKTRNFDPQNVYLSYHVASSDIKHSRIVDKPSRKNATLFIL